MRDRVINELENMGFRRYYKGFKYLVEIICMIYSTNTIYQFKLNELYVEVSKKYKVKTSSVKGDINYIVDTVVLDMENKMNLLSNSAFGKFDDNISTKKIIELILDKLSLEDPIGA